MKYTESTQDPLVLNDKNNPYKQKVLYSFPRFTDPTTTNDEILVSFILCSLISLDNCLSSCDIEFTIERYLDLLLILCVDQYWINLSYNLECGKYCIFIPWDRINQRCKYSQ